MDFNTDKLSLRIFNTTKVNPARCNVYFLPHAKIFAAVDSLLFAEIDFPIKAGSQNNYETDNPSNVPNYGWENSSST